MLFIRNKNFMKKELEKLPYFTLNQLSFFRKDKKNSLVYISRWLKSGFIKKIRNGIYVSSSKVLEYSFKNQLNNYIEYIATNLIYIPSYLSREYVLFKNGVLTENVYNFTLVTTKKTYTFKNDFWTFEYKSIKKNFFNDYKIIKKWDFLVYEASIEKALFDYFYFKRWLVFEEDYFLELRLNLEKINFKKFESLVKKYNSKKLQKVLKILKLIK